MTHSVVPSAAPVDVTRRDFPKFAPLQLAATDPRSLMAATVGDDTIRVATATLDALTNNLGELLVACMHIEQSLECLRTLQERTLRWQKYWRKMQPHYQRLQHQNRMVTDASRRVLLDFLEQTEQGINVFNQDLATLARYLTQDQRQLQQASGDLQNDIRKMRMLPIATLFDFLPRMVRDLAREQGKEVLLQLQGTEIEVDRQMLELLKDPLTHLLRNAVDHGIERPEQRSAAGKPRHGILRLSAKQQGSHLLLEISDDGRGLDLEALRRAAVERGLLSANAAAHLNDRQTQELIFHPGLSTASQVTTISGRGVGMDIVRNNLEQLHGLIQVHTQAGSGATFILTLPLTLITRSMLLVRTGTETVALPMTNIERILQVDREHRGHLNDQPAIYTDGRLLPLIHLAHALKLPEIERPPPPAEISVVVLKLLEKRAALQVDGFLSTQEVVIRPLGRQLRHVRNIAGATILGDGQLVIILNVADLLTPSS